MYAPGQSERVPLEVRKLRAADKDVLSCTSGRLLFLDLEFHDIRRVLNDLVNVSAMTRTDFTKNALPDPNHTANKPVALNSGTHQQSITKDVFCMTYPENTDGVV